MPSGIYKRRNADAQGIAKLLQTSKSLEYFYAKMKEVYKDKYTLTNITSYWKEKSKYIPKHLIETKTEPATSSLKDAETYLTEIVNEMRINNRIQEETLALFKRLEDKKEVK